MNDITYERLKESLAALNMSRTLTIIDNYLEKAIHDKTNVVEVLDYILSEEAKFKKNRAVESQILLSGFPFRKTLDMFDFSFQPGIDRNQIMELATMRFVENRENVVFLGPPGVGNYRKFFVIERFLMSICDIHRYASKIFR